MRHRLTFVLAALAAAGGCTAAPYRVHIGPTFQCGSDPRTCDWQIAGYRALVTELGYVEDAGEVERRRLYPVEYGRHYSDRWIRTRSDTTEILTVAYARSYEGPAGASRTVLRIDVSGRTLVRRSGRDEDVGTSPSLRRDVDAVADHLRAATRTTTL